MEAAVEEMITAFTDPMITKGKFTVVSKDEAGLWEIDTVDEEGYEEYLVLKLVGDKLQLSASCDVEDIEDAEEGDYCFGIDEEIGLTPETRSTELSELALERQ